MALTFDRICEAAERIRPYVHRTPVWTNASLNQRIGARVYLKCENFQRAGAFKFRGACNAVFSLPDDNATRGVCTHSSGNHAQALSLAARMRGVPAYVVMPGNASRVKIDAAHAYGGRITTCEPTLAARQSAVSEIVERAGATFVHPYDDACVIAGQGTAALELLTQVPDLDMLIAPVGGGGLLSATALVAAARKNRIRVVGAEPEGADDARRSLAAGRIIPSTNPSTIADGLRTSLGELTFPVIHQLVEQIVTVSERGIVESMKFILERAKILIEPSAAVAVASLWEQKVSPMPPTIGVILSGGNVDLQELPWQQATE